MLVPLHHFARLHLISVAGALGVIVLALLTRSSWLQSYDDLIELKVDPHRLRWRRAAGAATLTGEKFVHPVIAAISAIALIQTRPGSSPRFLIPLVVASLGGIIAHHLVKLFYHRPRPEIALKRNKTEGAYPSGHTTNATSVVVTSAYLLVHEGLLPSSMMIPSVVAICLATGASRVMLGWHWTTDVLGGYMAGSCTAAIACSLYWALH